jgi:hypothetical protein
MLAGLRADMPALLQHVSLLHPASTAAAADAGAGVVAFGGVKNLVAIRALTGEAPPKPSSEGVGEASYKECCIADAA